MNRTTALEWTAVEATRGLKVLEFINGGIELNISFSYVEYGYIIEAIKLNLFISLSH